MKLYILLLVLLFSCSHKILISETQSDNNDLLDNVKSENVVLDDFKIKEIPQPKKETKKETNEIIKKVVKKKTREKEKTVITKVSFPVKKAEPLYPEDYPESYKKLNNNLKKLWNKFKWVAPVGEEHTMEITFLGLVAGQVKLKNHPLVDFKGRRAHRLTGSMISAKYYRYIYELDDTLETIILADEFLPVRYTLKQRESGQKVDDLQLFDYDKLKTFHWYKRIKKDRNKDLYKEVYIPRYINDSFSALFFVRGLPLINGDFYEFPVITRGKMWILKLWVEKIGEIKINGKWVKAHKVRAETHFPGVLKKKGNIIFWYSADKLKKLLKFEAKVKIGTVEGVLIDYKKE